MAKRKFRRPREKSRCRFCREGITQLDYKDVGVLQKLVTSQGKLFSRKRSGNCAKCQHMARVAIKRARFLALMPYVAR
ncbi:MAG TPA: 30S ribosomal protein S18 [Planctomycetota bacterium]|nr:30S ribosomal protein S18 [Planctomycetota bacterium]HRR83194.1 30S ribosomal protein S18 [Planctomycetota bacterium]HRT94557.1 30S ribosomal protein S18 [Planctomycetota bacterium]